MGWEGDRGGEGLGGEGLGGRGPGWRGPGWRGLGVGGPGWRGLGGGDRGGEGLGGGGLGEAASEAFPQSREACSGWLAELCQDVVVVMAALLISSVF